MEMLLWTCTSRHSALLVGCAPVRTQTCSRRFAACECPCMHFARVMDKLMFRMVGARTSRWWSDYQATTQLLRPRHATHPLLPSSLSLNGTAVVRV